MRFLPLLALGTLSLLGPLVVRDARACGGCFHGPPPSTSQSPTVVTDHRMAVALSGDTTTLWDQIQYAGDPGDFSWVLPVQGGVTIGVGSASFIDTLDQQTTPVVHAPLVTCTYSYSGGYGGGSSSAGCGCSSSAEDSAAAAPASAAGGAVDGGSEGVTVTSRETVGPYDVVVIHGTDATSIVDWLKINKYVIPAAIQAILDQYVKEGFDFVAVRLSPGKGVQAMRPIRASWKGKSVSLPLRMVAAGVGDKVGIKLFVIGDGRWTVGNFDVFSLDASALTWDFAAARSDYTLVRDERSKTTGYGSFALESSIDVLASSMPSVGAPPSFDAGVSDGGGVDGGGPGFGPTTTDVEIAFGTYPARRVTRLRGDILAAKLSADLLLQADTDAALRPVDLRLTRWKGDQALCPGGTVSLVGGPTDAGATGSLLQLDGAGGCSTGSSSSPVRWGASIALGALATALGRRALRR